MKNAFAAFIILISLFFLADISFAQRNMDYWYNPSGRYGDDASIVIRRAFENKYGKAWEEAKTIERAEFLVYYYGEMEKQLGKEQTENAKQKQAKMRKEQERQLYLLNKQKEMEKREKQRLAGKEPEKEKDFAEEPISDKMDSTKKKFHDVLEASRTGSKNR
jgi:hypothetical protein